MTDYKLMPEEATPEMEQAAEKYWNDRKFKALSDDPRTWKGLYAAMRAAAPAVQGEPVAAQIRYRRPEKNTPDWSEWQPAAVNTAKPTYYIDGQGWEVEYRLLYDAPQPSFQLPDFATDPDDSDEVASLWDHGFKRGWNSCLEAVAKAMQSAEQQPDVTQLVDALVACGRASSAAEVGLIVDAALTDYRKGGGK